VAGNLAQVTPEERRQTLLTFRAEVKVYRHDHKPRAELVLNLPLSGLMTLPIIDCDDRVTELVTV
jgi:hypothetical protein